MNACEQTAVLLMSLDESDAAAVLKLMEPKEVEEVGLAMAGLEKVSMEQLGSVIDRFTDEVSDQPPINSATEQYITKLITQAVGGNRARMLIDRILHQGKTRGLEALKWMDTDTIKDMLEGEHPQIIAVVMAHMEGDQAGEILDKYVEQTRNDVLLRIANMDQVQESALIELDAMMNSRSEANAGDKLTPVGGLKVAADIINGLEKENETSALEFLRESSDDEEMVAKLEELMFSFDMLLNIDDRGVQSLLRDVTNDQLIISLKGSEPEIQDKIFNNMSKRAADMVRDDMAARGPVRLADVEQAQREILDVVRRLADEGTIMLGGKGEEFV